MSLFSFIRDYMKNWEHHARDLNDWDWCMAQAEDPAVLDAFVTWIHDLDFQLTGKTECRVPVRDRRAARDALGGQPWLIYLSDGGYSRLTLDLMEGRFFIDRFLSRDPVIERWTTLSHE